MEKCIGLLLAVLSCGAASAADLPVKARPIAAPAFSWTGGYIGGNLGGAWSNDRISANETFPVPPFFAIDSAAVSAAASQHLKSSGFAGGVQAGYNWQVGNWVWGLEADIDYLDLKKSFAGTFPFPSVPATSFSINQSISNNWLFTARPRVGWVANNWMIYATGGLAVGSVKFDQTAVIGAPSTQTSNVSTTRAGWTAGGGLEYAINPKWSFKAEYLYADLGKVTTMAPVVPAFPGIVIANSVRVTENIARVGLNYHY